MSSKDLIEFDSLLTMEGKLTDTKDESKKKGLLFTQFGGSVKKTDGSKGVISVMMSNRSQNVYHHLEYKVENVETDGEIWCGDSGEFARIGKNVHMDGSITLEFSPEMIYFMTKEVNIKMRNDEKETLETVQTAKDIASKIDMISTPWKYKDKELSTTVKVEMKELVPVIRDSDLIGQMHYPISIKKESMPDGDRFYMSVEAKSKDKIEISRKIYNIEVVGNECYSTYSVGIDSIVNNINGKILMRLGDWTPVVITCENEKFKSLFLVANVKQDNETQMNWEFQDNAFTQDETPSMPEKDVGSPPEEEDGPTEDIEEVF
jgi:hypothetical protein